LVWEPESGAILEEYIPDSVPDSSSKSTERAGSHFPPVYSVPPSLSSRLTCFAPVLVRLVLLVTCRRPAPHLASASRSPWTSSAPTDTQSPLPPPASHHSPSMDTPPAPTRTPPPASFLSPHQCMSQSLSHTVFASSSLVASTSAPPARWAPSELTGLPPPISPPLISNPPLFQLAPTP
jgi:hypothetical protein